MIVLGKKVLIVKRVILVVTDNKMTIQSLKNSCTGYNLDKTPGFLPPKSIHYTTKQLGKEEFE